LPPSSASFFPPTGLAAKGKPQDIEWADFKKHEEVKLKEENPSDPWNRKDLFDLGNLSKAPPQPPPQQQNAKPPTAVAPNMRPGAPLGGIGPGFTPIGGVGVNPYAGRGVGMGAVGMGAVGMGAPVGGVGVVGYGVGARPVGGMGFGVNPGVNPGWYNPPVYQLNPGGPVAGTGLGGVGVATVGYPASPYGNPQISNTSGLNRTFA